MVPTREHVLAVATPVNDEEDRKEASDGLMSSLRALEEESTPKGGAVTVAVLVAVGAAGWVVTSVRMAGMDTAPGANLGSLRFYISTWVVMMAAMMLPSAAPAALAYRTAGRSGARRGSASAATIAFAAGYLAVWAASGLLAYAILKGGGVLAGGALAWGRAGRWVAAGVLLLAAAYELTPVKRRWLASCRAELPPGGAGGNRDGGVRSGIANGAWCVGCCWALMAALFALGAMNLVWMAVIALIVGAQKLAPRTRAVLLATSAALVALALGLALAPASMPGLTLPHGPVAMGAMGGHS